MTQHLYFSTNFRRAMMTSKGRSLPQNSVVSSRLSRLKLDDITIYG
jgi:hypothetical protein